MDFITFKKNDVTHDADIVDPQNLIHEMLKFYEINLKNFTKIFHHTVISNYRAAYQIRSNQFEEALKAYLGIHL